MTSAGERDADLAFEHDELLSMHAAVLADATRYRVLFDLAPTALLVTDTSLVVREANEAAAMLFDVDPRYLLGKPLLVFVALGSRRLFRPLPIHLREATTTTTTTTMRRRSGVAFEASVRGLRAGDEIFWAIEDRTAEAQAEARLWELNRELEHRVREQGAELEALVAQLPVGVVVLAADGSVRWANERAEEIVGPIGSVELRDEWGKLLAEGDRPAARALTGETVRDKRVRVRRRAGDEVVVDVTAVPVRSAAGGAVIVLHDVTERYRIARADAEFVENAAHQLRTPITAIATSVAALQAGAGDEAEDRARFIAHVARESERMATLVEALLTLAALQRGAARPVVEVVPLNALVADAIAAVAPPETVAVAVDCADDIAVVADRALLAQSIGNVLANAVHHTSDRVAVKGGIDGPTVVLDVTDYGPGVPADAHDRVFERFFRASPNGRRGSGLGLAIAQAAAKAALTSLELLPQRPGEGATFRFTIPGARLR